MDPQEDKKFYKETIKDLLCVAPDFGKKFARMLFNKDLKCGNIFMHIEDSPNKNNKITLDIKELDRFGMPITNINYERPISVIKTAKNVMSEFAEFCRKDSIGRIAMHEDIFNLKKLDYLGEYHHMGGTRMGENLNNSVVDKNLKVHDINNLFVAGSSVFPTCGFTNPTFTIIQLSIRLSNHMKNTLQL
jgi:choline dehydrogenase-like flavoprotein